MNKGPNDPVYVWLFGFVGNTFYPQTQLGLTQQQVIDVAKNLCAAVGKQNLNILTAVDEIQTYLDPNGVINTSNPAIMSNITSYVSSLKQYSAAVYGRLDFLQYNVSFPSYGAISNPLSVYNQTSLYVNKLGLSGVWFDRSPSYYADGPNDKGAKTPPGAGPETFNRMMQNLTTMFPAAKFILNQAASQFGPITPFGNTTWEQNTYICPTVQVNKPGYTLTDDWAEFPEFYARFPGHVLLHFDAQGPYPLTAGSPPPMATFANMSVSQEQTVLDNLAINGTEPSVNDGVSYSMVYPIIGAWTSWNVNGWPQYNQTLYNSLTIGNYHRSTNATFVNIMKSVHPSGLALSSYSGNVGKTITVKGTYFPASSTAQIKFDGNSVAQGSVGTAMTFTASFKVPSSAWGRNNVTVTDGSAQASLAFYSTSKVQLAPSTQAPGKKVTVKGTGFGPAGSDVTIYINGSEIATSTVGSSGNLVQVKFVVPSYPSGKYTVEVVESYPYEIDTGSLVLTIS